jgi:hypothetical protein
VKIVVSDNEITNLVHKHRKKNNPNWWNGLF